MIKNPKARHARALLFLAWDSPSFIISSAGGLKTDMGPVFKNPMQFSVFSPAASLSNLVGAYPALAFSGSRAFQSQALQSCASFLPLLSSFSGPVGVGCASGIDQLIRSSFSSPVVFQVQPPISAAAFAARSARLVRWVHSNSGLLVAFPLGVAPSAIKPGKSFKGFGSGTWGSVAYALGLGVPVLLILPASATKSFPAPASVSSYFSYQGAAPCGGSTWLSVTLF